MTDKALEIDFDKASGVVPVVTQDYRSGRVLMVAYMNREAFAETVKTGRACYFSRSRNKPKHLASTFSTHPKIC